MGKFINPFTDVGFKRIFGQEVSRPLLLDFLNNLFKGEKVIKSLTFLDKEQPADYRDDRSLIYDVYCKTDTGERIIVEMQNREQPNFSDRCLYYFSQAVSRQGEKGTDWTTLTLCTLLRLSTSTWRDWAKISGLTFAS